MFCQILDMKQSLPFTPMGKFNIVACLTNVPRIETDEVLAVADHVLISTNNRIRLWYVFQFGGIITAVIIGHIIQGDVCADEI